MANSPVIEIIISLMFVYLILSIAVSGIVEVINKWRGKRGVLLQNAIDKLLNDPQNKNWADLLYNHPLVNGLKKTYKSFPSYISSEQFSSGIIDVIMNESKKTKIDHSDANNIKIEEEPYSINSFECFKEGLKKLNHSDFKKLMTVFINESQDIHGLKVAIAKWYDNLMDRVSGWFNWSTKKTGLYAAIAVTLLFNIDSIEIANTLWEDDQIRKNIVSSSEQLVAYADSTSKSINDIHMDEILILLHSSNQTIDSLKSQNKVIPDSVKGYNNSLQIKAAEKIDSLALFLTDMRSSTDQLKNIFKEGNLPFGWKHIGKLQTDNKTNIFIARTYIKTIYKSVEFSQIIGWLITIIAITFGAPFWFNSLNKLVNMRNAGNKPKTQDKS